MAGVAGGRPRLDDGTVLDVASVVWCTGFRQVFDWIRLPILGADGWPVEYRGVVDAAPGLYFCGLSFQYAFSSMVFPGISRDADYVARQIVARVDDGEARAAALIGHAVRSEVGGARWAWSSELIRAREAYDRREWLAAYDGLSDAAPDELHGRRLRPARDRGLPPRPAQRLRAGAAARLPAQPRRGRRTRRGP